MTHSPWSLQHYTHFPTDVRTENIPSLKTSGPGFCSSLLLPQCEKWVSLKVAYHSRMVNLPVPFTETWQSLWICEFNHPYLLFPFPPCPFTCTLQRELSCCKQTASWGEELRADVIYSSFLSGKRGWKNSAWNEWRNSHPSELLFQVTFMSQAIFTSILYYHLVQDCEE